MYSWKVGFVLKYVRVLGVLFIINIIHCYFERFLLRLRVIFRIYVHIMSPCFSIFFFENVEIMKLYIYVYVYIYIYLFIFMSDRYIHVSIYIHIYDIRLVWNLILAKILLIQRKLIISFENIIFSFKKHDLSGEG